MPQTDITAPQDALIGALIGLARTAGDANRAGEAVTRALLNALSQADMQDDAHPAELTNAVHDLKFTVSPSCRTCASPCGRTSDFDFAAVRHSGEEIGALKLRLFSLLCRLAGQEDAFSQADYFFLMLMALGEQWEPQELLPVVEQAEKRLKV